MLNYQSICTQVTELSKEAGSFIRNEKGKINAENIETKSLHSS